MSSNPVEFGFVAALEREVQGLVKGWSRSQVETAAGARSVYSNGQAAVICGGTGAEQACVAARVLVEKFSPRMIISIGFAGSCVAQLGPGSVVVPASVVDSASGARYACAFGRGSLVTLDCVAGTGLKQCSAARFGAEAVEMEAAGVARAAVECKREFAAIKAISDGSGEDLEFLAAFVSARGFDTGRFVAHIALRPQLWPKVAELRRNSGLAARALAEAVGECIGDWRSFAARESSSATPVG